VTAAKPREDDHVAIHKGYGCRENSSCASKILRGVAISHVVEVGFRGPGRVFDAVLRFWLTREFANVLSEHVRTEFPKLRDLLRSRAPLPGKA